MGQAWGSAGQGQDSSLFDAMLKDWYMSRWIDLMSNKTTSHRLFRRRVVPFKGRRMVIAYRTGRSGAVGAIAPSGTNSTATGPAQTITPDYQQTDNAYVKPKLTMAGIAVPQDTQDISEGDAAAFYDAVDLEMMGIKVDTAQYLDLTLYRGGTHLGTVISEQLDVADDKYLGVTNFYGLDKGKQIEFWASYAATAARADGPYKIAGKFRSATTTPGEHGVILGSTPNAAIAAGDQIYHANARGTDGTNTGQVGLEMLGLEEIISDSNLSLFDLTGSKNYLGRSRTNDLEWQSTVDDISGALTFDAMQAMIDRISDESAGATTAILTHRDTRRTYAKRCLFTGGSEANASYTRWNDTMKTQGGLVYQMEDTEGGDSDWMTFDGRIPVMVDKYASHDFTQGAQEGTMYFVDTRHFYYALVTDWRWWAPNGHIMRESQSNYFGTVAHAYTFGEFVCDAPNTQGKLTGISV